eukprot:TRINITY_DN7291_c0_g1_i2.p1 TRINITY_DN7291_c0_g1~~TRINITY_DN7291_c0_g1_i2.p1  ORF type:complete len:658 (+),score=140.52 TRINITY_DN7291_c0_g1_i2:71-2044(+)
MNESHTVLEPLEGTGRIRSMTSPDFPRFVAYYIGTIKRFTSTGKWKSQTAVCTSHMLFISTSKEKVSKAIPYKDIKEAIYGQYGKELIIVLTLFSDDMIKWRTTEGSRGENPMQILMIISNLRARYYQGKGLPAKSVPQMEIERKQIGKTQPLSEVKSRLLARLPVPDPLENEVVVKKDKDGSIGLCLSDHMGYIKTIEGSPCDVPEVKRFEGHILSHVDGIPVTSREDAHFMVVHSYGTHVVLRFADDVPTPQAGSPESMPTDFHNIHKTQRSEDSHEIVEEKELPPVTRLESHVSKSSDHNQHHTSTKERTHTATTTTTTTKKEKKTTDSTKKKQPTPELASHLSQTSKASSVVSSTYPTKSDEKQKSAQQQQQQQQQQQRQRPKQELVIRQEDDEEDEDFGVMMEAVQNLVNRQSKTEDLLWSILTTMDSSASIEINPNAAGSDTGSYEGSPNRPTFKIQQPQQQQITQAPVNATGSTGYDSQHIVPPGSHPQSPANMYVDTYGRNVNYNNINNTPGGGGGGGGVHQQQYINGSGGGGYVASSSPTPNFREPQLQPQQQHQHQHQQQQPIYHPTGLHSYPTQSPSGAQNASPRMYHVASTPLPPSQQPPTGAFPNTQIHGSPQPVHAPPAPHTCRICHAQVFGAFCHSCGGRVQ